MLLHWLIAGLAALVATARSAPVRLIVDTDFGGGGCRDVDDVGAVCVANALADAGEVDLLAVVHDTAPPQCVGAISVVQHWYGRDHVPIGAYKGTALPPDNKPLPYIIDLVNNWPSPIKNASQVDSSLNVYRRVLAAQPDRIGDGSDNDGVTISSIGLLVNIEDLLRSGPDNISPLTGLELVRLKVGQIAVMGGKYPSSNGQLPECNFCGGAGADHAPGSAATAYVLDNLPSTVSVIYSGFNVGVKVLSGGALTKCAPAENPCRQAYRDYEGGTANSRFSWDPLNTLMAVRGPQGTFSAFCNNCDGKNSADSETGNNAWVPGPRSNQTYITLRNASAAGKELDALLCAPPKWKV